MPERTGITSVVVGDGATAVASGSSPRPKAINSCGPGSSRSRAGGHLCRVWQGHESRIWVYSCSGLIPRTLRSARGKQTYQKNVDCSGSFSDSWRKLLSPCSLAYAPTCGLKSGEEDGAGTILPPPLCGNRSQVAILILIRTPKARTLQDQYLGPAQRPPP